MALKDYYDEADILESLSWCGMPEDVRITRLSLAYMKDERNIRSCSRGYCGPTKGTVGTFVKSLYKPPRGKGASTIEAVINEIERIKTLRAKRAENRPYKAPTPPTDPHRASRERKRGIQKRMNRLSQSRFKVVRSGYYDREEVQDHNCVGITTMGGCLVIVDKGGYYSQSRVYIKDKFTGEETVYILKKNAESVTAAMTLLAPKGILRGLFDGKTCLLSPEGGFEIDGEFVPFRNVAKVCRGDELQNTPAKAPG